jgi:hypothetical protein
MTEVWFGKDKYHLHQEMYQWCADHLGEGGWGIPYRNGTSRWGLDVNFGNSCFYFRYEEDATLFALKWQ